MFHLMLYGLGFLLLFLRSLLEQTQTFPLLTPVQENKDTERRETSLSFGMYLHDAKCLHTK